MQDDSAVEVPTVPLTYPWPTPPEPGRPLAVAPGVHWLRMPLPFALDHINLWLLEDGPGWTVVDTGLGAHAVREIWKGVIESHLGGRPITRVIVTHYHPDHLGQAGWLTRTFGAPLWMTRTEFLLARMLYLDRWETPPDEAVLFYRRAGLSAERIEAWRAQPSRGFRAVVSSLPLGHRRIVDGETVMIGGRAWQVIVGRGHSPEHACLHCPELDVLISGDQVLPRISSNVSVHPSEPEADPLSDWIASCAMLLRRLPDTTLVLPAHNEPFRGVHGRLRALIDGHEEKLQAVLEICATPKRATEVFGAIFRRPVRDDQTFLALGESLSHLRCLVARGQVDVRVDEEGAWRFQAARDVAHAAE